MGYAIDMAKAVEIELKLTAAPAMLPHLRGHPLLGGEDEARTLVTCYFDTAAGALHRGGATLRRREGDGDSEQTFKSTAKGGNRLRRGEWNAPATGAVPDPAAFPPAVRQAIAALVGDAPLQPLATTRIQRTARRLRFGGSTIEAAFDSGMVEAGDRSEPVSELELELIEGDAADLFALAQQLPLGPELGWSVGSKGERGLALAFDLPFAPVRSNDVPLTPAMTVGEGFRAIAWNCLAQLLGNYREVIASGDADAVHQSRVAIRRLRAAFSLFGDRVADAESPIFRAEWKAVASGLGPARDLHVLTARVEEAAAATDADAGELIHRLRGQRAAATRDAQTMLAGATFQRLLVRFAEWLERDMPDPAEPLAEFAERVLARRRRGLVKGKPLDTLSDEDLHALRIRGKKLRYAAEFFACLYPGEEVRKQRRAFVKALGRLQDCLGSVNDLAVAHGQRPHLFADLEPIVAAGLSAQLGELLDGHGPGRKRLVKSAAAALERVADAPAWWKFPARSTPEDALSAATTD